MVLLPIKDKKNTAVIIVFLLICYVKNENILTYVRYYKMKLLIQINQSLKIVFINGQIFSLKQLNKLNPRWQLTIIRLIINPAPNPKPLNVGNPVIAPKIQPIAYVTLLTMNIEAKAKTLTPPIFIMLLESLNISVPYNPANIIDCSIVFVRILLIVLMQTGSFLDAGVDFPVTILSTITMKTKPNKYKDSHKTKFFTSYILSFSLSMCFFLKIIVLRSSPNTPKTENTKK